MSAVRVDTVPTELVRFLMARADDEDDALRKRVRRARVSTQVSDTSGFAHDRQEILARRQVLGHVQHLLVLRDLPSEKPVRDLATQMLLALVEPYRGHLSFRKEWRAPLLAARAPAGSATTD